MENKNRLILSVVLVLIAFLFNLVFVGGSFAILFGMLLLFVGIWTFIESIIFVRKKKNRDALPLILIALYIALSGLLLGFLEILQRVGDFGAEGFQGFGFLWYFISILVFLVLGIWAVIKGIILVKNKKNIRLGIISLIIGGILSALGGAGGLLGIFT